MSQSDGKRRIKIQKLMLDPLSNWFYSRREIGDSNGVKFNPLENPDPQLSTQASKKIYEVRNGNDTRDFHSHFCKTKYQSRLRNVSCIAFAINTLLLVQYTGTTERDKIYTSFSQQIIRNLYRYYF